MLAVSVQPPLVAVQLLEKLATAPLMDVDGVATAFTAVAEYAVGAKVVVQLIPVDPAAPFL
jgi:hypothetical protein